jgi:hypothetical protein
MNVIKIMGGLGNQIFQWSFGRAMIAKFGTYVKYEVLFYEDKMKWPRSYLLDRFNLHVTQCPFMKDVHTNKESQLGFKPDLLKRDNENFLGYWQYKDYYESILPILQQEIKLREEVKTDQYHVWRKKIENDPNSIGVHVRRGDYLKQTWGILPFTYYMEAIRKIKGNLYIFSDDQEWCKCYFRDDYFDREINFVHEPDYIDFELLRFCKHQIMASSTFSWWAAFLNDNPNKIVIAPKKWLGGTVSTDLVYPQTWIKI